MYKLQWIKDKFNKLQYKMWKLLYILHNNFWVHGGASAFFAMLDKTGGKWYNKIGKWFYDSCKR